MIRALLMALDLLGRRGYDGRRTGPIQAWRIARSYWRAR